MRSAIYLVVLVLLVLCSSVLAQTTSPLTSTTIWDLQTSQGSIALDSNMQYVSGTGVRLTSSATSGVATFTGTAAPFAVNNVVPSWNVDLPNGTGIRTEVRAVNGGTSTVWYEIVRMGTIPGGIQRKKSDTYGYIDIDTLMLNTTWPTIEYRATLYSNSAGKTPTLRLMSLCYADTNTAIAYTPLPGPGVTTSLPVPWRSQYWVPDIGGVICGPTSLTMAEDYYGCNLPTETVAADAYDSYNKLYGNWPLLAQAAAKHGFKGYVFRANGQQPVRDQIAAGNAVIMSMAYSAGELTNSPITSTNGHLVLMVGITSAGDYICNDPAGADSRWDHVTYNATQIAHVWGYHAGGVLIAVMPNLVYGRYPYFVYPSTAPVVSDTSGKMNMFARGVTGVVYSSRQMTLNGTWGTWGSMSGPAASTITSATNRTKGNTIFARFTDGNLYYRVQAAPGGTWGAWTDMGGSVVGNPAVGKSPDGRLDVFSRFPDGSIRHRWEATTTGWQSWESLDGSFSGDPVIALSWEGREEVFARGTDNQLYWKYQLNNGTWSAWASLGGTITGQPAIGRTSDGRTEVYCRFADGTLRSNVQNSTDVGTTWAGWTTLSAATGTDVVIGRAPSGLQEMFFADTAGHLIRGYQTTIDGGWATWESLGGTAIGTPIVGHHDNGLLQVFIFQADGKLWAKSQQSGGGYSSWFSVSPVLFADVVAPVVNSVTLTPTLVAAEDQVQVQVNASDNVGVQSVTADTYPLAYNAGVWSGLIPANDIKGSHTVRIEAKDAANNTTVNESHTYTTAPIYSLPNRGVFEEIISDVQSKFLFMVWGCVTVLDSGTFTVDDGSGMPVTVHASWHGLTTGKYVIVRGPLNRISSTEASLTTTSGLIQIVE